MHHVHETATQGIDHMPFSTHKIQAHLNRTESVKLCVNVWLKWTDLYQMGEHVSITRQFLSVNSSFWEVTISKTTQITWAAWTVKQAINLLTQRCDVLLWLITAKQTCHQSAGYFQSRCSDWLTVGKSQVLLITRLCSIHSKLGRRSKIPAPWNWRC